ncbi:DUF4271 domain-containing protein [Flammeovirga kamogawensis]|uniref:DUF4271 domain-containing protein n=1 Tax=Flammeovirga kamogawensis TaxID=373891 RepID=A0ABX8GSF6_9BACT|nr:DUF4271 domain-containing protein [Flammeovirga kamogawensis]QWG06097.1 DUF4271 domain-containing protein [Flammeovirga kamogawensis]TRX67929.1 DUF4271 domain-containing protein [Flammeovirga kamogawensis]
MKHLKILVYSIILICLTYSKGMASSFPLEDKWLIYEKQVSGFVPYFPSEHPFVKNFYLLLDIQYLGGLGVEVVLTNGDAVFLNNQLKEVAKKDDDTVYFSYERLKQEAKNTGEILLVVNTTDGKCPLGFMVEQHYGAIQLKDSVSKKEEVTLLQRSDSNFRSYLLMWSLVVFFIVGIVSKIGGLKTAGGELLKSFEGVTLGRSEMNKVNSLQFLMFILSFALVASLTVMLFGAGNLWLSRATSEVMNSTISSFLLNIFYIIVSILAFVAFRLIVIYVLGGVFGNSQISSIHGVEFYKLTWVYVLFYMVLCVFWTLNPFYISWEFMRYFLGITFFLKSFLVYIAVSKQVNLRNNYLFSYFCATEFLPSLVAVKVFFS